MNLQVNTMVNGRRTVKCTLPGPYERNYYYEIIKVLGKGGQGTVYLVRKVNISNNIYSNSYPDEDELAALKITNDNRSSATEAWIQQFLKHPNILNCEISFRLNGKRITELEVMSENLKDYVQSKNGRLNESQIKPIIKNIFRGLQYLHGKKIIHGDIKEENILRTRNGQIKIADFGLSVKGSRDSSGMLTATAQGGTKNCLSPETALYGRIACRSDIFATGLIFYRSLMSNSPCYTRSRLAQQWTQAIVYGRFRFDWTVSSEAKVNMCQYLAPNSKDRPSARDALASSYFTE